MIGLCESKAADPLAACQFGQVFEALRLGTELKKSAA